MFPDVFSIGVRCGFKQGVNLFSSLCFTPAIHPSRAAIHPSTPPNCPKFQRIPRISVKNTPSRKSVRLISNQPNRGITQVACLSQSALSPVFRPGDGAPDYDENFNRSQKALPTPAGSVNTDRLFYLLCVWQS
jgi:hypothetical protein